MDRLLMEQLSYDLRNDGDGLESPGGSPLSGNSFANAEGATRGRGHLSSVKLTLLGGGRTRRHFPCLPAVVHSAEFPGGTTILRYLRIASAPLNSAAYEMRPRLPLCRGNALTHFDAQRHQLGPDFGRRTIRSE